MPTKKPRVAFAVSEDRSSAITAYQTSNHIKNRSQAILALIEKGSSDIFTDEVRTCIHNRGMPDGRGFFSPDKETFRSHTDVWQGKSTQYGGKMTGQTAFNGCEYRSLKKTPPDKGEEKLVSMYHELNLEGQERILIYADDLVSPGKYKKGRAARLGKTELA